ncbi:MAG: glycosyltransferase [Candidatus Micrarchaeota archaeon]|nr:glycosyltransferase [Candidatus Micrarchaeota archaeon]MDE1824319.1 glycosyltransferase [Candidatus Micrarchaeota archaeon]MDE1850007.1 glycosyltransferase [Candidatus Micrarchaeota archaeon]
MRIGLMGLEDNFVRNTGLGIPVYMYELLKHLKKMQKKEGFKVEKIGYERKSNELSGFMNMVLKSATEYYGDYDILHNPDVKPIFPRNRGKAIYVSTGHDYQPLLQPELDADVNTTLKSRVKLLLEIRYSLRLTLKSDYILARSTLTRDDAVKLGFDRKKIFVVGGAVDDRYRKPIRKKENRNYIVGYLGAFRTRKNVSFAIRAFNRVSDRSIKFDMWGKPVYEYEMLRKLAGGNRNIRFRGFAPEERMVEIYDSFDAFVFPSLYEGLCLPIFEAYARGLPVIIYKHAKIPEETRKYCFEAEDEEHMAEIIKGLKLGGYDERRKKKAMNYARSLTWEKTAKDTLAAYRKML